MEMGNRTAGHSLHSKHTGDQERKCSLNTVFLLIFIRPVEAGVSHEKNGEKLAVTQRGRAVLEESNVFRPLRRHEPYRPFWRLSHTCPRKAAIGSESQVLDHRFKRLGAGLGKQQFILCKTNKTPNWFYEFSPYKTN